VSGRRAVLTEGHRLTSFSTIPVSLTRPGTSARDVDLSNRS